MSSDMHKMDQINPTSREAYAIEGPGVGGNADVLAFLKHLAGVVVGPGIRILDIGFGQGEDLVQSLHRGAAKVCGADIAQASLDYVYERAGKHDGRLDLRLLDVCDEALPWEENYFDVAVCTEAIEHMPNPYRMVAEVKRVLKPDGIFLLAFPDPMDNDGYDGGKHAHTIPGFLHKPNFEKFMRQLYFHKPAHRQNGSSAWYTYENYKGPGIVDLFHIIAGNYTEEQLFGMLDSTVRIAEAW